MRVVITGAAGFIGTRLASALLARARLCGAGGRPLAVDELVLVDRVRAPIPANPHGIAVSVHAGDLCDADFLARLFAPGVDSVFALAATLTSEAETDFAKGLAVNVHSPMRLLEACRAQARAPRLVFTSSIAAFGGPLPETVDDSVARTPQTSYGTHKAIVELLLDDYSRHGFVDARALRLPVVLIRPAAAAPTVSDRIAAIVREPLLGCDVVCPLAPQTLMPVASAARVAQALLDVHDLPASALGHTRAMNLPSLSVRVADMAAALEPHARDRRLGRIIWEPDARLQAVVDGWPHRFVSERASRLGIRADASFGEIVETFLNEQAAMQAGATR